MPVITMSEEDVQTINLYRKRFKEAWDEAKLKNFRRLPESIGLETVLNKICQQAQTQGVELE